MQTNQFITDVTGNGGNPRHQVTPDDELRAYTAALNILEELGPRIAGRTASPTQAGYFALKAEQAHRYGGYAQILAADLVQRTLAHELPVAHLDRLQSHATDPDAYITGAQKLPEDPRTVPTGRPTFKNATELLQKLLNITFPEARDRINSVAHLLPHTDVNGIKVPPKFPMLADELTTGKAAPRELRSAAKKLEAIRPHINQQPDPPALASELEQKVATSVHTEDPGSTQQLLNSIKETLERQNLNPSEEVVRARIGLFYRGFKSGVTEFVLRVRPQDAEFIFSLCAQTDNPRTKTGDRAGLLKQSSMGNAPQPTPTSPSNTSNNTDAAAESTVFPDFLLAPSATTGEPIATPEELAALTLGGNTRPPASSPEAFHTERFETLNQSTPGDDGLTPAQRHLQGLLNLLKSNGRPNGKKITGLPSPQMLIIATLAELEDRATSSGITQHGQRLSPAELRQNLCICGAIPIIMNGKSQILDLGRAERYFPDYMRQAILARDGGCIVPGCTVPPEHCEIHHLDAWEKGGLTRIEDGVPLCSNHHHAIHAGLLRALRNAEGLPAVILPKFMDPAQTPRRNTYWTSAPAFTTPPLF